MGILVIHGTSCGVEGLLSHTNNIGSLIQFTALMGDIAADQMPAPSILTWESNRLQASVCDVLSLAAAVISDTLLPYALNRFDIGP
jgi:hypothetical protein